MSEQQKYAFETLQVHAGQEQPDPATDARAVPIYLTVVLRVHSDARHRRRPLRPDRARQHLQPPDEPHRQHVFEERVAALEGGVGCPGVALPAPPPSPIAVQNIATAGDHIVSSTRPFTAAR